jgi:hypothetical protein
MVFFKQNCSLEARMKIAFAKRGDVGRLPTSLAT